MTLQDLASREDKLQEKVSEIYNQPRSESTNTEFQRVVSEYKMIHREYSKLSLTDIEALKRGLFIQWYCLAEPLFLAGIGELDEQAENNIIDNLNRFISSGEADTELLWMVSYYCSNWSWVFEKLEAFKKLNKTLLSKQNHQLPDKIDREQMQQRGTMGKYWNSLTRFSDL